MSAKRRRRPSTGDAAALLAPGDGLRRLVGRPRPRRRSGASASSAFALLALLPLYTPPFLDTPGISFGGTMAQFAMVAIIAIGLNVVVGQAGLLDLGYVGFYAVGAYTVALLTSPDSPWNQMGADRILQHGLGLAGVRAAGDGDHRARRADPRHADAAAAR